MAAWRCVLGIGNPGIEYEGTRHNAGFEIADRLARRIGATWTSDGDDGRVAERVMNGVVCFVMKPGTYVNRTGRAVRRLMDRFGADFDPAMLLVAVDDMALPPGRLRLRSGGSDGGHNGLRSVAAELGTEEFPRLRAGIGGVPVAAWREHVLARPTADEASLLDRAYARAAETAEGFLSGRPLAELAAETNRALPRVPDPATGKDGGGESRPVPPDRGARQDGSSLTGDVD